MLLLESTVIVVGSKNRVLEAVDMVFINMPAARARIAAKPAGSPRLFSVI